MQTHKTQSELTTLMLAWQLARVDNLSQPAAIRRCARRLRDTTKDMVLYDLFKLLASAPESKLVQCVQSLHGKLIEDGLLFAKQ